MSSTISVQAGDYGRQFADFYDRLFPPGEVAEQTAEALTTLLPPGGGRVLELGVGTGRIAIPLARRVGRVVGVDASPEMLTVLRETAEREKVDVTAVEADICDLGPLGDQDGFALAYCICSTLLLVTDPDGQRRALQEAAARLAPGGHLVIETHNVPRVLSMTGGQPILTFFVPTLERNAGILSSWFIDRATGDWRTSQVLLESGTIHIGSEHLRLTTGEEFDAYAADAGLVPTHRFSDWSGTPYTEEGHMFIGVYRKPVDGQ
ncbi:class I SAM-dependent methyltransferase [Streptomyces sp. NPDC000594]|uniref:class I SAM-dependent methyltransferase n=1 Tax=Streptomyces sp. NPDC000594 TaxID=3154261 RepID=UPI00331E9257